MSVPDGREFAGVSEERHAHWVELFFDLVVVVGVAQLAHLLHPGHSGADVGLYALLFLAFWTVWMSFTMYANASGDETWHPALIVAMFGMAVMAAAIPEGRGDRAGAFALAYVLTRVLAARVWRRGERIRVPMDWPIAQAGLGVTPWVLSLWTDGWVQVALWGLGLALDLTFTLLMPGQSLLSGAHRRWEKAQRRGRRAATPEPKLVGADPVHLTERLGLFVIIVLGEGVTQVVVSSADVEWDGALLAVGLAAFALIVSLWVLTLQGFAGLATLIPGDTSVRAVLLAHCITTGLIAAAAAGLGGLVEHPHGPVEEGVRWTLCAPVAGYFGVGALTAAARHASRRWMLVWGLPSIAVPLLAGGFGARLSPVALVVVVAAPALWQVSYRLRTRPEDS